MIMDKAASRIRLHQYQKKYSNMIFERKKYLDELIVGRGNGLVKIITGM